MDNRSDLYAVGAVAYFLLTGHPVFSATNIMELCRQHVDQAPVPPSQRLGRVISPELEDAILACLEKNRAKRPQTARNLAHMLARLPESQKWTENEADGWWSRHERGLPAAQVNASMVAVPTLLTRGDRVAPDSGSSEKPSMTTPGFDQTMISQEID